MELNERLSLKAGLLALFVAMLWGGNSVSLKVGLAGIGPMGMAALRFMIGVAVVAVWAVIKKLQLRPQSGELRSLLVLSVLFFFQIAFLNVGADYTLAGRASIFISTYPFFTAIFAHFMLEGDRLSIQKIGGMAISFAGIIAIFGEGILAGEIRYIAGDLLILFSGLLLGLRVTYTKRLLSGMKPEKLLFWQGTFSLPVYFIISFLTENPTEFFVTPAIITGILYQGLVVAGFCFLVQTNLVHRHGASRISTFGFIPPISGVILSALLLGEPISIVIVLGMLLVAFGIYIVNRAPAAP